MTLEQFLSQLTANAVSFDETMTIIDQYYHYSPVEFSNGSAPNTLINAAGANEKSCKIFAFAQIHQLSEQQTLALFGKFYWQDVLEEPEGNGHQNIRNFMTYGWQGIRFNGTALVAK
ncbi:MAG: HopJ type III effector protein [Methylococcales bacterium]|jgi:hypothetical protein|nr:HopJ type III effector protein [Methylococcales bacterium]